MINVALRKSGAQFILEKIILKFCIEVILKRVRFFMR